MRRGNAARECGVAMRADTKRNASVTRRCEEDVGRAALRRRRDNSILCPNNHAPCFNLKPYMKCRGERGDRLAECGREASLQAAGAERCAACGGARQDAGGRTSKAEPHWRGDGRTRCDTESTLLNVRDDSALCADAMNHVLIKTLYEIEATSRRSDVRVIHADVMQRSF